MALLILLLAPITARGECHPIEVNPVWAPTGVAGCERYGVGVASWWQGPGVARNDCLWPWTNCRPITIRSLDTGRTISVVPSMYGDLYSTTPNERIVDLDPAALKALGLWERRSQGLFRVVVLPAFDSSAVLPNTAVPPITSR